MLFEDVNIDQTFEGYIKAILFTENIRKEKKLSQELLDQARIDVTEFCEKVADILEEDDTDFEQLGIDFWLTRNRHGAGFWNGDWPINGDRLTEIAESFGERWIYKGDDKKFYCSQ